MKQQGWARSCCLPHNAGQASPAPQLSLGGGRELARTLAPLPATASPSSAGNWDPAGVGAALQGSPRVPQLPLWETTAGPGSLASPRSF